MGEGGTWSTLVVGGKEVKVAEMWDCWSSGSSNYPEVVRCSPRIGRNRG
jgi:hypothetical protein